MIGTVNNFLVYVCFGTNSTRFQSELICSLLSLNAVASAQSKKKISVVVYTDRPLPIPHQLIQLPIYVEFVDPKKLADWIAASGGYIYVVKPKIIHSLLTLGNDVHRNVILIDTDTYFRTDPMPLFGKIQNNTLVMHMKEQTLKDRAAVCSYLLETSIVSTQEVAQHDLWNGGVVGLSSRDLGLLDEVIRLTENIACDQRWPSHENIIEQCAFSLCFNKTKRLIATDDTVIHYWYFKEFRFVLSNHFSYFSYDDEETLKTLMRMKNIDDKDFLHVESIEDLPALMSRLIKQFLPNPVFLNYIPEDSYTGKLLRR